MPSWPSASTNEVFVEKKTTKTNRNAKKQRDNDDFIVCFQSEKCGKEEAKTQKLGQQFFVTLNINPKLSKCPKEA
jgi:hypothetical protein